MTIQNALNSINVGTRVTIEYKNSKGNIEYALGKVIEIPSKPNKLNNGIYYVKCRTSDGVYTLLYGGLNFFEHNKGYDYNIVSVELKNELGQLVTIPSENLLN